jgi:hypothetical protein
MTVIKRYGCAGARRGRRARLCCSECDLGDNTLLGLKAALESSPCRRPRHVGSRHSRHRESVDRSLVRAPALASPLSWPSRDVCLADLYAYLDAGGA